MQIPSDLRKLWLTSGRPPLQSHLLPTMHNSEGICSAGTTCCPSVVAGKQPFWKLQWQTQVLALASAARLRQAPRAAGQDRPTCQSINTSLQHKKRQGLVSLTCTSEIKLIVLHFDVIVPGDLPVFLSLPNK